MLGEIILIGVGIFLFLIVVCLIGIVFEMHQYDDFMEEYLEGEEDDGCEDFFATTEEVGLHDYE